MKKVRFMETVLRDAHQSLMATRMRTQDMLPSLELLDKAGYYSLEMWGGATFDACLRFLNEDPWERLRLIRSQVKNTKLQMLLRGQNILGYKHYSDQVVERFIRKSIENGIDIIRLFDALNDVRNLQSSIEAIKKEKGIVQCAVSYTESPVHNNAYYVKLAKQLRDMGADTLCIKDMAGIMLPGEAFELVSALKSEVDLPLEIHTHSTSGTGEMTYLKAIEAGADIIDTAISPFGGGTSQPATESMAIALERMGYDTGLNLDTLFDITEYFDTVKSKYVAENLISLKVVSTDSRALKAQIPGGMLSNLVSQLKSQGMEDKYTKVLKEVPLVRADMGYPPLVTPLSQMVGTQAVFNVISGERYKMIPKEIKDYVKGKYGTSPSPISEEIVHKIIGDEERISYRPADKIPDDYNEMRDQIKEYARTEEDVLSYILFPEVAEKFLKEKWCNEFHIEPTLYNEEDQTHPI